MPRLVAKTATGEGMVIQLKQGLNRLGREADNDFPVDDKSVSGHHCEVQVLPEGVWVRDLGSTNGTFLDEQPVQETWLQAGQTLRLGTIAMVLETEPEFAPALEPPLPANSQPSSERPDSVPDTDTCLNHVNAPAKYVCYKCGQPFCADCIKVLRAGMREFYSCPKCGGTAGLLSEQRQLRAQAAKTFFQLLPGAFAYPVQSYGSMILVSGAFFFSLLEWGQSLAKYALLFGFMAVVIMGVVSGGYFFAFMKEVARSAAAGEDKPPRWPEVSSFAETFVAPFFQLVVICLLCLAPGMVVLRYWHPAAGMALIFSGLFCMPMALLTVTMVDSLAGLNPMVIFSSIAKVPGQYLAVCAVFLLLLAIRTGLEKGSELAGLGPLGVPFIQLFSLYSAAVQMRLLGLLYFKNKDELAWFHG